MKTLVALVLAGVAMGVQGEVVIDSVASTTITTNGFRIAAAINNKPPGQGLFGGRSWFIVYEFNCTTRTLQTLDLIVFTGPTFNGDVSSLKEPGAVVGVPPELDAVYDDGCAQWSAS